MKYFNFLVAFSVTFFIFNASAQAPGAPPAAHLPVVPLTGNLDKLMNFYGRFKETGVLQSNVPGSKTVKEELSGQVWFERPTKIFVEYDAPERFKGVAAYYDGNNVQTLYPKLKFAVHYKNLPNSKITTADFYQVNPTTYNFTTGIKEFVAGLTTQQVLFAQKDGPAKGEWKIHPPFSFPLVTKWEAGKDTQFSRSFNTMVFNREKKATVDLGDKTKMPDFKIPPGTMVAEFDFGANSVPDSQVLSVYPQYSLPRNLPDGLKLTKLLGQNSQFPAYAALYTNGGTRFLIIMFHKNLGPPTKPASWGIPLRSVTHNGELTPTYLVNTYSFVLGDMRYFLTSTLPPDEMLKLADQIGLPVAKPKPAGR